MNPVELLLVMDIIAGACYGAYKIPQLAASHPLINLRDLIWLVLEDSHDDPFMLRDEVRYAVPNNIDPGRGRRN